MFDKIMKYLEGLEKTLDYKRLSKRKSWKIKKFTRVNGSEFFKCYYNSGFLIWYVDGENGYYKDGKIFLTEDSATQHIKNMLLFNETNYMNLTGNKIAKVEVVKSKKENRQDNIDKIL